MSRSWFVAGAYSLAVACGASTEPGAPIASAVEEPPSPSGGGAPPDGPAPPASAAANCGAPSVLPTCVDDPGSCDPGAVRWAGALATAEDDRTGGVALDGEGRLLTFWYAETERRFRLDEIGPAGLATLRGFPVEARDGAPRWSVTDCELRGTGSGRLLLGVGLSVYPLGPKAVVDVGAGWKAGEQLAVFGPEIDFDRLAAWGACDSCPGVAAGAFGPRGDVLVGFGGQFGSTLFLNGADGQRVELLSQAWTYSDDPLPATGPLAGYGCSAATFVDDVLVCAGGVVRMTTAGDSPGVVTGPDGLVLVTLDRGGAVTSVRRIASDGVSIHAIAPLGDGGFAVAGVFYGAARFGGTALGDAASTELRSFVGSVDAAANPRWAVALPGSLARLAADARDRIVVVTRGVTPARVDPASDLCVHAYDAGGTARWTRALPGYDALPPYGASRIGVALRDGEVVVSGGWSGTFDFGTGAVASQGADGFVVALAW